MKNIFQFEKNSYRVVFALKKSFLDLQMSWNFLLVSEPVNE